MVFPIVGGDGKPTGYEIDNSLRFNDDDNPYLSRTPSSSGSRTKATVSFWVKRSDVGNDKNNYILEASSSTSPFNMTRVRFSTDDDLVVDNTLNGNAGNGFYFQSDRKYRDVAAWYHIFFSIDVTQANSSDAWRLYVNGVQQTKALTHYTQNANLEISQSGVQMNVGRRHDTSAQNFDGYLAEYHYIDGTVKAYTDFGEFNDNGVWIPKKYDGGSYGTNGFYFKFDQTGTGTNSSGMGADSSGNDNHFAVSNLASTDVTTDTCTNNFATLNPVSNFHCGATYQEGNTRFVSDESKYGFNCSSIAVSSGKWYAEFKPISKDGEGGNWYMVGIAEGEQTGHRLVLGRDTGRTTSTRNGGIGWVGYGTNFIYQNDAYYDGDSSAYSTAAYTENDILGIALNADDNQATLYKNGTAQNSGTAFVLGTSETGLWHFACGHYDTGNTFTIDANFGNPPYSNSSGNADANGYGDFEYAPPSGYYALCTKNLAEYG